MTTAITAMSAAARADANRRRRCAIAASLRAHDVHQLAQSASFAVASSAVTRLESIDAILFVVVRFAVFVVVAAIAAAFAGADCRLVAAFYGVDFIVAENRRKIVDVDRLIVAAIRHRRLAAVRRRRLDAIVVSCWRWFDAIVVAKRWRRLDAIGIVVGNDRYVGTFIGTAAAAVCPAA